MHARTLLYSTDHGALFKDDRKNLSGTRALLLVQVVLAPSSLSLLQNSGISLHCTLRAM